MKTNLIKFILTLTIATILIPQAVYAIGVTPLRVSLSAEPGKSTTGSVIVQNTLDENQIVVLAKADFFVSEDESVQFYPTKDEKNIYSMQDWIEFEENNVLVPAKQGKEIKYTITVPAETPSQGYYGAVFISGQSPDKGKTPGALTVEANVAQLVLFQVPGELKAEVELKSYEMKKVEKTADADTTEPTPTATTEETATTEPSETPLDPNKAVEFTAEVHNTGNTHIASTGTIVITDQETKEKLYEEILVNNDKYNSMPNRDKTYVTPWNYSKLAPGGYVAMLSLDLDKSTITTAETPFVINEDGQIEIGKTFIKEVIEKPLPPDYTLWIVGIGSGIIVVLLVIFILLRPKKNANK